MGDKIDHHPRLQIESGDVDPRNRDAELSPMKVDRTQHDAFQKLQDLLMETRAQLARALDEADELQAWDDNEVRFLLAL